MKGENSLTGFYPGDNQNTIVFVFISYSVTYLLTFSCHRGGRYTENDAKSIVVQILSVASFCHLQGVVHRDLKPEVRGLLI